MYWVEAFLGLILIAAPFALNYRDNPAAFWGSIVLGAVIVLASGYKVYTSKPERWEGWVDVAAGVAAVLLPFVFGFSTLVMALWTFVVVGVLVALLSGYDLYMTRAANA